MTTRTLTLTSPHARGALIKETQKLLKTHGYLTGKADGEYGPDTAAAAHRAKWALGYPDDKCNGSAGDLLRGYLSGKKTPLLYRQRAASRAKHVAGLGEKTLALAKSFEGYTEHPPGSNLNQFGLWYGANGWPWCAEFVSYVLSKCGYKWVDPKASRWAYCPYVVHDAQSGKYGLKTISAAKAAQLSKVDPGAGRACILVLFDWDNDGVADHIGFYDQATGSSTFTTVEGNTSAKSNSNGGQVELRIRNVSDVQAFVLVSS
jgi:hypothetical protein